VADDRKVFRIDNVELLGMLKLPENEKHFSFAQLMPSYNEIGQQAERVQKLEAEKRTAFEKQVMKLYNALMLYQRLKISVQPPHSQNLLAELEEYKAAMAPGVIAVRASQAGQGFDQKAYDRILEFLAQYNTVARFAYILVVPPGPADASRDEWKNIGTSLMESVHGGGISPAVTFYATMVAGYQQNNPEQFNKAVSDYRATLAEKFTSELRKGSKEFFFNGFEPFYKATVIYVMALVLGLAFWFNLSEALRRSALCLIVLAWLIHTFGLGFRMFLEGRPPVTNLYSSAIFIGWAAVVFGLGLELIYRDGIGLVVAAVVGFVTQIVAHNLALGGDTMEMLRAVLDTNFWLATHVVIINLGYASTYVAGFLGIVYILRGVFTRSLDAGTGKSLARMVYGIICFATLFSFVGTVLGGIWADQSWGRFWGWDPKENGALLIVIWNAVILHARWGGLVRERGIMNMAVVGNIITTWSYFGVNMLGIGLHSYGFMDAAFKWLMLFIASQMAIIAVGLLPLKVWKSFQARASVSEKPTGPSGGKTTPAPAGA
jgi:ABC-type transport system involved in cytochrome c biogenesis permease subunit